MACYKVNNNSSINTIICGIDFDKINNTCQECVGYSMCLDNPYYLIFKYKFNGRGKCKFFIESKE